MPNELDVIDEALQAAIKADRQYGWIRECQEARAALATLRQREAVAAELYEALEDFANGNTGAMNRLVDRARAARGEDPEAPR